MQKGKYRSKFESQDLLRSIFSTASQVRGKTESERLKTEYGLKDRFAEHFLEKIFKTIQGKQGQAAKDALQTVTHTLPQNYSSPVWRIKGLDPHTDTPVEILHVILLGVVKYFWWDAVDRVSERNKPQLIARLSSIETKGLGISPIGGKTLAQYCRLLTGRDFRVISQAVPFVLHDLGLPSECIQAWMALSSLVPLIVSTPGECWDTQTVQPSRIIGHKQNLPSTFDVQDPRKLEGLHHPRLSELPSILRLT
ncbi:hypothetical protein FRC03_007888 [Tulasnella sp. 419]|nr:hypothetical protein FRC03_007888 [Tulasnella sp. 419]